MKIPRLAHSCLKGFMLLILVLAGCSSPEPGPVAQSTLTGRHDTLQKAAVNQARSKALRSPKSAEERARYAYALSVHGLHKDAAYEFSNARLLDSSSPLWHYRTARSEYESGLNKADHVSGLEEVTRKFPAYLPAKHFLATAYLDLGQMEKAWNLILECLTQAPRSNPLLATQAEILLDSGLHKQALEILKAITERDTRTPFYYRLLGEVYLLEGNAVPEQVENMLVLATPSERTIVLDPLEQKFLKQKTGRDHQIRQIQANLRGGNTAAADKLAQPLLNAFPGDPGVRNLVAQCMHAAGRSAEARKVLEEIPGEFKTDSSNLLLVDILVQEAQDLQTQGANSSSQRKIRRARDIANEVIGNTPSDWKAHFVLGKCLQLLNDLQGAKRSLLTALSLNQQNVPTAFRLFEVATQLNDRETGKQALDTILVTEPENLLANIHRGLLAVSVGDIETAKTCLERASKVDPAHEGVRVLRTRVRSFKN